MPSKDPYEILGVDSDTSMDEVKQSYIRLCSKHFEEENDLENFLDIGDAYIKISKAKSSITIYEPGQKRTTIKPEPILEKMFKKQVPIGFVLGVSAMGLVGGLIGYNLQPRQTIVREIVRERVAQNSTPAPAPSTTQQAVQQPQSSSQKKTENSAQKVTVETNSSIPSQKILTPQGSNPNSTLAEKGMPTFSKPVQPLGILPLPPSATGTYPQKLSRNLQPEQVPTLPAPTQKSGSLAARTEQRDQSPNTNVQAATQRLAVPLSTEGQNIAKDEEADKLIAQIDSLKSSQGNPQGQGVDPTLQSNIPAPEAAISAQPSPEKILKTIQIPLEDGTSIPATKLLSLNTNVYKLDKGRTREKLGVLINSLVESKNLNEACEKSGISIGGLQLLIKQYGST